MLNTILWEDPESSGRLWAMSGRKQVMDMHPGLSDNTYLVSGHHGCRKVKDGRIIMDKSGGNVKKGPIEAIILPDGTIVNSK